LGIDNQWQNSRYTNHNDETVTDTKTGLMWKQCPEGSRSSDCLGVTGYTYKEAIELAENTTFATYSDWRLPNIKELASLAAHDRYDPAINSTLFPNTSSSSVFWSSSPNAYEAGKTWTMHFYSGYGYSYSRDDRFYVRLVRGIQ
jgi:hypothetical protein